MSDGSSLEGHAWLVWSIARKAKLCPNNVSHDDVRALHMVEEITLSVKLRALASQTIADVIVHCEPDVVMAAHNYGQRS